MLERQSNQGGADWLRERAGHATASRFCDILAVSKRDGKPLKARDDYLMELVVEQITGEPIESASSFAMKWGTDAEPYARAEYEAVTGLMVKEVGFMRHPSIKWVGASSDGLVGDSGGTGRAYCGPCYRRRARLGGQDRAATPARVGRQDGSGMAKLL